MKSTIVNLIAALVRQLIGSDLWSLIVIAVSQQDSEDKPGSEKAMSVKTSIQAISTTAATWLINLAIEAAVAKLRVTK